jgi:hypothetical protein
MAGSRAAAEDQNFTTGKDGVRRGTVWGSIKAGMKDALGIAPGSEGSVLEKTGEAKTKFAPGIDESKYK